MKVKMTNSQAVQLMAGLQELQKLNNPVPAVVGYRIVQNIHALATALAPYNEVRERAIQKYAPDGRTIRRDTNPEAFNACEKELHEIDKLEISVDVNTFPLSMIAESKFPISVIFALDFMIDNGS